VSEDLAWKDLERFVKLLHRHIPEWPYLVVMERQKRGAPHFHLAAKGWQKVLLLRSCWRKVVGDGNIDVKAPRTRKGGSWKRAGLGSVPL
jgi:hypothetical protein